MPKVSVDGVIYECDDMSLSIYQFLSQKGIVLPCFCYHEQLKIAGNCRMCLVEANSKVVVSCATPLDADLTIVTSSELLSHCRENVLEFLLANHPLDCPICDQGGECDLQDISKTFGLDRGRFYESKRSVDNLNCFGPLVKTLMTRCIHCTRCVRFLTEYCDDSTVLGLIGRGSSMEIGSFTEFPFIDHPLSANVIDLCPVGALTSMPSAFKARPWESKTIESIDIMDSLASGLRFEVAQNKVVRCTPQFTENLNQDFITNKARFVYQSLGRQQMTRPMLKQNGQWVPITWRQASLMFHEMLFLKHFYLLANTGNFVDLETAALLKSFCKVFLQRRPLPEKITAATASKKELFLLNSPLSEFEENTTLVLTIGCNLRKENPLVFLRLRRSYLRRRSTKTPLCFYSIGSGVQYDGLPVTQLGCSLADVQLLVKGRLNGIKDFFFTGFMGPHLFGIFKPKHARPKVIVGQAIFEMPEAKELQHRLWNFCAVWQEFLEPDAPLIYNAALNYLGALSMCAVNSVGPLEEEGEPLPEFKEAKPNLIWDFQTECSGRQSPEDFVIYQGYTMPSEIAQSTDLFIPTASPLEHSAFYLNLLGIVRQSKLVLSPLPTTNTNAQIIRFFFRSAFRYLAEIKNEKKNRPHFLKAHCIVNKKWLTLESFPWAGDFAEGFEKEYGIKLEHNWSLERTTSHKHLPTTPDKVLEDTLLTSSSEDYYSSDVFSRSSPVLRDCSVRASHSNFDDLPPDF